jgi:hypothetical protein
MIYTARKFAYSKKKAGFLASTTKKPASFIKMILET